MSQPDILNQAFELGFTYTRSTGPVVGRFLTELKKRNIVGIKASDGRVVVPPMEYDPDTAEALSDFVAVGQEGEVVSFAWVKHPREAHPMGRWCTGLLPSRKATSARVPASRPSGRMTLLVLSPISGVLSW